MKVRVTCLLVGVLACSLASAEELLADKTPTTTTESRYNVTEDNQQQVIAQGRGFGSDLISDAYQTSDDLRSRVLETTNGTEGEWQNKNGTNSEHNEKFLIYEDPCDRDGPVDPSCYGNIPLHKPHGHESSYHHKPDNHGYSYKPDHHGYDHKPDYSGYAHKPDNHGYDHKPDHHGYDHKPDHYGYDHKPDHHGYDHKPDHHGYDHKPDHHGYDHKPDYSGYDHKPENHGYDHKPDHHGYDHKPDYSGYAYKPDHHGYDHKPEQPEHDHKPDHPVYGYKPGYKPDHPGYDHKPDQPVYGYKPGYKPDHPGYDHKPDQPVYGYKPENQGYDHKPNYFSPNPDQSQQGNKPQYYGYDHKPYKPDNQGYTPIAQPVSPGYDHKPDNKPTNPPKPSYENFQHYFHKQDEKPNNQDQEEVYRYTPDGGPYSLYPLKPIPDQSQPIPDYNREPDNFVHKPHGGDRPIDYLTSLVTGLVDLHHSQHGQPVIHHHFHHFEPPHHSPPHYPPPHHYYHDDKPYKPGFFSSHHLKGNLEKTSSDDSEVNNPSTTWDSVGASTSDGLTQPAELSSQPIVKEGAKNETTSADKDNKNTATKTEGRPVKKKNKPRKEQQGSFSQVFPQILWPFASNPSTSQTSKKTSKSGSREDEKTLIDEGPGLDLL